jgi:CRP/FNR family cyclic AMP-dependent transcriptional regulator
MTSNEILQQHPIFSQLSKLEMNCLIEASHEETVSAGQFLFHKEDVLIHFYLVVEGEFEINIELPKFNVAYGTHGQPSELQIESVVLSTVKPGEIMGWSGLVPPFKATSGGKAKTSSKVIAFDCQKLLQCFELDCRFGYLTLQAASQAISKRLSDIYKKVG